MILGFFIGVMIAGYMYLHSQAIGFTFPNIDGVLAVRPTIMRVASYLTGRWVGYSLLGLVCGGLGQLITNPLIQRWIYAIAFIFILYIFLFLFTNHSPEMFFAEYTNPKHLSLPLFITGLLSAMIFIAPLNIACFLVVGNYPGMQGAVFFTYVFFGYAVSSMPLLLNMKWRRIALLIRLLRLILTVLTVLLLVVILQEFLNS